MSTGSLTVIGTGIKVSAHITVESQAWIKQADSVFFVANDSITAGWLKQLNPNAIDLGNLYAPDKPRLASYREMVAKIVTAVRQGHRVCAVFYGHPGVFVWPSHEAIAQVRRAGFEAHMLPGISAEDCLFADLGIDPARGCQSFEATDFLIRPRRFDTATGLVLWQIGVVGRLTAPEAEQALPGLAILVEVLIEHYGPQHDVIIYEAARYPGHDAVIQQMPLNRVSNAHVTVVSTMYVPPKTNAPVNTDMLHRLGLSSVKGD